MSNVLPLSGKSAPTSSGLNSVEEILADLRAGRMVIIMDDEDRENEGDLIMAADRATPEAVAFMIRYTSGIICVPMEEEGLVRLDLPQMVMANSESHRTAFTVSVDLKAGTTTGVSSADRAATIRALADSNAAAADFARPGHIFPLRSRKGGVLVRAGHTEASVDLCRLAGLKPAGVLCEIMNDDGTMARRPELEAFAKRHNLKIGTIADLIRHRLRNERSVERISEQTVQTDLGEFRLYAYEDRVNQDVHLALARGRLDGPEVPLVRVHLPDTLRDLVGVQGSAARVDFALRHEAHCRGWKWRGRHSPAAGVASRPDGLGALARRPTAQSAAQSASVLTRRKARAPCCERSAWVRRF